MWGHFYSKMVDGEDLQSHSDAYQRIIALFIERIIAKQHKKKRQSNTNE